jgi:hypothetical protein
MRFHKNQERQLNKVSSLDDYIILLGFKCIEMIIYDYLHDMDIESVKELIVVIENFKRITCKI